MYFIYNKDILYKKSACFSNLYVKTMYISYYGHFSYKTEKDHMVLAFKFVFLLAYKKRIKEINLRPPPPLRLISYLIFQELPW